MTPKSPERGLLKIFDFQEAPFQGVGGHLDFLDSLSYFNSFSNNILMNKKVYASLLITLSILVFSGCAQSSKKEAKKPYNILLITVDDLRPDLGCYGADYIKSPNIDELANKSMVFEMAYCQSPICGPSRASFLTGLRPHQSGINKNDIPIRDYVPDIESMPQYFKNRGYQAEAYGKIFHQTAGDSASWDYYDDMPKQRIFNLEINTRINDPWDGSKRGRPYEGADVHDSLYTDGIIVNKALHALNRFDMDTPFFLAVGFLKPHLPFNAPKKYWDLYDNPGKKYNRTLERPEGHHPKYSFMNSAELRKYYAVPKEGDIPADKGDTLVHGYYACISYMDAQVGKLMDKLEELGVTDNTIVILYGDHGFKLGDFNDWCKNTHFDLDNRVPLIIHHPGKAGGRTKSLAELVDIYPTLVDAAGDKLPDHELAGVSLMPIFENPETKVKEAAFSERPRSKVTGFSMRTENHRLIKWLSKENPDSVAFLELYEYGKNNLETKNLANDPDYEDIRTELLHIMEKELGK